MRPQKTVFVLCFLIIFIWTALVCSQTGSPQETLKQYMSDLQKNPDDFALREKIIKLVQGMTPQPAIPQEAKRPFIKGVTFQKEATSVSDYELAIKAFNEALLLAPWWPEAYYNLSLAQEVVGKFDDSIRNLKLYLLTNPKDKEEAENRMYALEAKKEKAAKDAAGIAHEEARKSEEFLRNLSGTWVDRSHEAGLIDYYQLSITGKNAFSLKWIRSSYPEPSKKTFTGTITGTKVSGDYFRRDDLTPWGCGVVNVSGTFDGTVSADGKKMRITVRGVIGFYDIIHTCSKKYMEISTEFTKE